MLTLTSIVLTSTLAFAADRSAPANEAVKEIGGGLAGVSCGCVGDLDHSGAVDAADLALLLGGWNGGGSGDLDESGTTDAADLAMLLGAWGACPGAPENDNCVDAIEIGLGVTPFCTTGATIDGPAYPAGPNCAQFNYDQVYADVWYTFTAIGDGELTIKTCGTNWDTRLAFYGAAFLGPIGCPTGGDASLVALLGCNDDTPECGFGSKLVQHVQAGHQYKIRVGGYNGFSGAGELELSFVSDGSSCLDAIPVSDVTNTTVFGTTVDNQAGTDDSPCGTGDTVAEWFVFESNCPGENAEITISTCTSTTDFDTVLTVWKQGLDGCMAQLEACNDDATGTSCQLGALQRKSRVTFLTDPGAVYYVRVSGYLGATGEFSLKFTTDQCN
jgi:hypothetical protein